jgi:ketosteroid isomerase-like protein
MRVIPVLFFAFLLSFNSRLAAQTPAPAPDPKAFEAVGALSNGVQSHDAVMTASAYADDAVVLPPTGETIRGKAAIEAFWKQQFTTGFNAVDGGSNGLSTSGDLGYEWGSATFEVPSGAQTVTDVTKYVNVLKKDASGSWKIAMTIWTSSRPH